jgi:hypothetical protein
MTKEEIEELVKEELADWAVGIIAFLQEKMQDRDLVLSGELYKSLRFEVLRGAAESAAQLRIIFQDSGRIRDMRRVQYKKLPPIKVREDYVTAVGGSSAFKYVPGYKTGGRIPTESVAVNRIAWGIATSKLKRNKTKPKKWFAKPFYQQVGVLIDQLMDVYSSAALKSLSSEFNQQS